MARDRKKEVKLKKLLLVIWFLFIVTLGTFGYITYQKRDVIEEDLGFTTKFSYQTNANQDINALIITYLNAMARCDQDTLKSCVTNPSQFNNMTNIQSQSKIITNYNNINCYTVNGLDEDSTIVYAVSNISIVSIESTPLDMLGPYYVVKKDGEYLIDNSMHSEEVVEYMEKVNKTTDIQELYRMVKEDEDKCAEQDPAFKEFIERLNN